MDKQKIIESLSENETKILPYLNGSVDSICGKSNLDRVSVLRALEYLENKKIVKLSHETKKIAELGVNGLVYARKGLPERRLLNALERKKVLNFQNAQKTAGISEEELKASIGVLRRKNLIEIKRNKIMLSGGGFSKKMDEELFLDSLPRDCDSFSEDERKILKFLENRKEIVDVKNERITEIKVTDFGKEISGLNIKAGNFIEQITPEILKKESHWKSKKFRRYDVASPVPGIFGGKRHFVNQASDYARKVWTEMGFGEMTGDFVQSSFWNFDALFTAQDHPVREMQDTFFLNRKMEISDKKLAEKIRESHEGKLKSVKSKGWQYSWNEDDAKKTVLRTHTTVLSAQTLARISVKELPAKFFALGKCFRNETLDWKHGFEFNQTEGIVADKNANFRHLLGYLKQFFKKMGFEKIRFRPAYFPYTEPSVEIDVYIPERKEWIELGGAGIFRPEVVVPLLGENIPVLAWGPGFDRMLMDYYGIKDIRELYKNDINQLRKIKFWMKS